MIVVIVAAVVVDDGTVVVVVFIVVAVVIIIISSSSIRASASLAAAQSIRAINFDLYQKVRISEPTQMLRNSVTFSLCPSLACFCKKFSF